MEIETVKKIIFDNYNKRAGSLLYFLNEDDRFSRRAFWEFYDALACVAAHSEKISRELAFMAGMAYQKILEEFIAHFSPRDVAVIDDFPENYTDYIERLDFAMLAILTGDLSNLTDERFALKRMA